MKKDNGTKACFIPLSCSNAQYWLQAVGSSYLCPVAMLTIGYRLLSHIIMFSAGARVSQL